MLSEQRIFYKFINLFLQLYADSIMCVIVSTHFSGSNRATGYMKVAWKKRWKGTWGESAKTRGGKDDRQGRGEGAFSVQMHEVVTAICTHAYAFFVEYY